MKQTLNRWTDHDELGQISRMALIWSIAVITLFSLSQIKLPHYISSIYPAMALGISAQWHKQEPGCLWVRAATLILMVVCVPLALMLMTLPDLYSYLTGMVKHPHAVAIMTQGFRPGLSIPAAGAVLLSSLFVLFWQTRHSSSTATLIWFILFGLLLQTSLIWSMAPWAGRLMQAQLLNIAAEIRTYPPAVPVHSMVNCPSVSFYSGRSYREVKAGDLEQLAFSSAPYLLVARTKSRSDISFLPLEAVVREKDFVLFRNARALSSGRMYYD
jgi:hypothetical protein